MWKTIATEFKIACYFIKINFENEASLRLAFLLQMAGMFVNNLAFLIIWIFFFKAFGQINNWSIAETIGLQGFIALTYGFVFSLFDGSHSLPSRISNGGFDSILLSPRNLYVRIIVDRMSSSAFGDIIFGIVLLVAYIIIGHISLLQILLMIGLIIPSILVILNISILASLLAFFFNDGETVSRNAFDIFFSPSMYPAALYQGVAKIFFLLIIPSLAVGGIPIEVIRDTNLVWFLGVWLIAIFWTRFANFLLHRVIKRYESGNLLLTGGM